MDQIPTAEPTLNERIALMKVAYLKENYRVALMEAETLLKMEGLDRLQREKAFWIRMKCLDELEKEARP